MGQEASSPIDENTPPDTLEARTLEALAKYIKDGRASKIVVMVGAGISTSAGIPDFRSPDTGLYANLARLDLPYAEAVFDISFFRQNPAPFYALAQELYPGRYRPTITHSFIRLLQKKGLLLKLFTQNIDCLEREAGLPAEYIVEAHGSFASQACIECKSAQPDKLMHDAITTKTVPYCTLEGCNGLVKPDIVFFGEALPAAFGMNRTLPASADLCIVMGSSLQVQPFASLPQFAQEGTPRLLINYEAVGGLGSRADDVLLLGDCDTGVRKLARALGWLEELESLWAETSPKEAAALGRSGQDNNEDKVTDRAETVDEEVDRLTKEVNETLKMADDHRKWALREKKAKGAVEDTGKSENSKDPSTDKKDEVGDGLGHVYPHLKKPQL